VLPPAAQHALRGSQDGGPHPPPAFTPTASFPAAAESRWAPETTKHAAFQSFPPEQKAIPAHAKPALNREISYYNTPSAPWQSSVPDPYARSSNPFAGGRTAADEEEEEKKRKALEELIKEEAAKKQEHERQMQARLQEEEERRRKEEERQLELLLQERKRLEEESLRARVSLMESKKKQEEEVERLQQEMQQKLRVQEEQLRQDMERRLREEEQARARAWEEKFKSQAEAERLRLERELHRQREEMQQRLTAQEEKERRQRAEMEEKMLQQAQERMKSEMAAQQSRLKQEEEDMKRRVQQELDRQMRAAQQKKEEDLEFAQYRQMEIERRAREDAERRLKIAVDAARAEEAEKIRVEMEEIKRREQDSLQREKSLSDKLQSSQSLKTLELPAYQSSIEIPLDSIRMGEKVGEGRFGEVFKAQLHGQTVAVKRLKKQEIGEEVLGVFMQEVSIVSQLHHPNIVLLMGVCTAPGNIALVSEFMVMGSVDDILFRRKTSLSFKQRIAILHDAALGMTWLHSLKQPILHRDLKTANILVNERWEAKICDFGLSNIKGVDNCMVGSPYYMAPEVLTNDVSSIDTKSDVYSYGIVMWEVITNEEPYKGAFESFEELVDCITMDGFRMAIPSWVPQQLRDLITACWSGDPADRPSFQSIIARNTLPQIVCDFILTDAVARAFWADSFIAQTSVDWKVFVTALSKFFEKPLDPASQTLIGVKELCTTKTADSTHLVTMELFQRLLDWFGPLDRHLNFISRVNAMLKAPWFFGECSQTNAEAILGYQPKGSYLLRFGSFRNGVREFILSVKHSKTTEHVSITQRADPGAFECMNGLYDSIDALIKGLGKKLRTKTPAVGSKYIDLRIA